jgi:hypothetical protein
VSAPKPADEGSLRLLRSGERRFEPLEPTVRTPTLGRRGNSPPGQGMGDDTVSSEAIGPPQMLLYSVTR